MHAAILIASGWQASGRGIGYCYLLSLALDIVEEFQPRRSAARC